MKIIIALLIFLFIIVAEAEITSSGTEVYQGNPPWDVDANITNGSLNVNVLNPTSGTVSVNGTIPVSVSNTVTVQGTTASIPKVSDFTGTLATAGTIAGPIDMAEYPIMYLQVSGLSGVIQVKWYNDSLSAIAGLNTSPNNAGSGSALPLNISSDNTYVIPKQGRYAVIQKTVHTSGTVTVAGHLSSVPSPLLNLDVSSRQAGNYIVRTQDGSGNSLSSTNGSLNVFVQFPSSQGVFGTMGRSWVLLDSTDSVSVPGVSTAANQVTTNGHLSDIKGSLGINISTLLTINTNMAKESKQDTQISSLLNIEGSLGVLNTDKATATNQNITNSHLSDIKGSLGSNHTQLVNLNSVVAKEAKQDTQIVSLLNLEGSLGIANAHLLDIKGSLGGTNSKLDTVNTNLVSNNAALANIQGSLGSSYVQEVATNTNLVQLQGSMATANSQLAQANTNLSDIEGSLGISHGKMDTGNSHLSDIKGSLGNSHTQQVSTNTNLIQIQGSLSQANVNLSDIEGSLGVSHGKMDASNSHLSDIKGSLGNSHTQQALINTNLVQLQGSMSQAVVNLSDVEGSLGVANGLHTNTNGSLGVANQHLLDIKGSMGSGYPVLPGIVRTTTPGFHTAGTYHAVTMGELGMIGVSTLAKMSAQWGRAYHYNSNFLSSGSNAETPLVLIRNPTGSGRVFYLEQIILSSSTSSDIIYRFYLNPTVSANGTSQTVIGGRQTGQDATVTLVNTLPTAGTLGSVFDAIRSTSGSSGIIKIYGGSIMLDPNNSMLITVEQGQANQAGSVGLEWREY